MTVDYIATCDRCKDKAKVEEGHLPYKWCTIELKPQRISRLAVSGSTQRWHLCPECKKGLLHWMLEPIEAE